VVACLHLRNGLVAIEQPELHLHPALQVTIGDLFIEQAVKNDSVFLLETHSEHLLLRLLRRIRETSEDELPPGIAGLTAEQLSVNFVEQTEEGLRIRLLKVSQDGDSSGDWPKGFFDERSGELF
jgi:predicted ATPase